MRSPRAETTLLACGLALLAAGCAHHFVNPPLTHVDPAAGYRFSRLASPGNSDRLFVILTFSGGGTRASALAYGVLEALSKIEIPAEGGGTTTLLDEVDVISSVSGGSFTAAYYALFGKDKLFSEFEPVFLRRNIQGDLKRLLLYPSNWVRLASPNFDRIDMAARFYDRHVFEHKTFEDLVERGRRPYVIMNSTEMGEGARFEFTQDQFDFLCSDLGPYPIARGVAASSAFPGLLTPITLHNHADACGYRVPQALSNALQDRWSNPRRYMAAWEQASYLVEHHPYVHVIDGGVADNIGLRGPFYALTSNDSPWSLVNEMNNGQIEHVVVIVVNAQKESANTLDDRHNAPNLIRTLQTAAGTPMAHYSFETIELLRDHFEEERKAHELPEVVRQACPGCRIPPSPGDVVGFHDIEVSFDKVEDPAERTYLQTLPTSFALPDKAIDALIRVGPEVLEKDAGFQELLRTLRSETPETPPSPPTANR